MADPQNDEDELEEEEEDDEVLVPAAAGAVEESLDELVTKHPDVQVVDDDEEESLLDLTREERLESLSIKAAPKQANEFVCSNCHLVKHNSQLSDRKRELCRDCV